MNLDVLSPHRQDQYKRITEYKENHSGCSDNEAERKLGIPINAMSAIRAILRKNDIAAQKTSVEYEPTVKRKTKKPKMITLPVEGPITSDNIVAFVGNTRSVVEAIREYQR